MNESVPDTVGGSDHGGSWSRLKSAASAHCVLVTVVQNGGV